MLHEELSNKILKSFYAVYHCLGHGFLEKVYENAMMVEMKKHGIVTIQQQKVDVFYDGVRVGDYVADAIVDNKIILEFKIAQSIAPEHEAQLINYLKATRIELGFILNFGPQPQFARCILTNDKKKIINH